MLRTAPLSLCLRVGKTVYYRSEQGEFHEVRWPFYFLEKSAVFEMHILPVLEGSVLLYPIWTS